MAANADDAAVSWTQRSLGSLLLAAGGQFSCSIGLCGRRPRLDVDGRPLQNAEEQTARTQPMTRSAPVEETTVGGHYEEELPPLASYSEVPGPCDHAENSASDVSDCESYQEEMDKAHGELMKVVTKERKSYAKSSSPADHAAAARLSAIASASVSMPSSSSKPRSKKKKATKAREEQQDNGKEKKEEDEDEDLDPDDPNLIDKHWEKERIGEKVGHLRKVMESSNTNFHKNLSLSNSRDRGALKQQESAMHEAVGEYQQMMEGKLGRLGEPTTPLNRTKDPSQAVCEAVSRYHGACTRIGIVYAEPDLLQDGGDMSNMERDKLARWQEALNGTNSDKYWSKGDSPRKTAPKPSDGT